MLGAIAGDIIGSVHEFCGTKTTDFPLLDADCRFTDDTVLTVAVADSLMTGRPYVETLRKYFREYPMAGYGMRFTFWAGSDDQEPYNSWGNGSAMRVSPVAYVFDTLEVVMAESKRSAEVTHNHPEGVRGAQAAAAAVFLARTGESKKRIKDAVESLFHYNLSDRLDQIRPNYHFDESCERTVPPAIVAFLESESYEEAVRNAISLGGDADTLACIAGAIAEPFYGGVPSDIAASALALLDDQLRTVTLRFCERFGVATRRSLVR
jgi:ADP-ribosylglycohydrolase